MLAGVRNAHGWWQQLFAVQTVFVDVVALLSVLQSIAGQLMVVDFTGCDQFECGCRWLCIEVTGQDDGRVHQFAGTGRPFAQIREAIDFGQEYLDLSESHILPFRIVQEMCGGHAKHDIWIGTRLEFGQYRNVGSVEQLEINAISN